MNLLEEDVKLFIVQSLACFNTPTEVSAMVKEEFDIEIERQNVARYDPTKVSGKSLGNEYKTIFEATRKRFLDNVADIPAASASYRVAVLQKMLSEARQRKNNVLAAQHLEQIAKEVGGMYTNKVKIDHASPDGSMSPRGRSLDDFYSPPDAPSEKA